MLVVFEEEKDIGDVGIRRLLMPPFLCIFRASGLTASVNEKLDSIAPETVALFMPQENRHRPKKGLKRMTKIETLKQSSQNQTRKPN